MGMKKVDVKKKAIAESLKKQGKEALPAPDGKHPAAQAGTGLGETKRGAKRV